MRSGSVLCLSVVLLLPLACGDDGGGGSGSYIRSCDRACERGNECDSSVDVDTCSQDCQNRTAAVGPNLSGAYLAELDRCVEESTCVELAIAAVFNTCDARARSTLGASAAAQNLCDREQEAAEMCPRTSIGEARCLDSVKVFADGVLNAAARCFDESCDQHVACIAAELGVEQSDLQ